MLRTAVEMDFRITLPVELQGSLRVGDELLITLDKDGRIFLMPKTRALEILAQTAGMWSDRTDIPADGVEYVNQLRQGHRLWELGIMTNENI